MIEQRFANLNSLIVMGETVPAQIFEKKRDFDMEISNMTTHIRRWAIFQFDYLIVCFWNADFQ